MHYLDELLMLYRGRDPRTREFFLGQMADVPLGFDSDALLDLLWSEVPAPERPVAAQARRELGRLLPTWMRFQRGLEAAGQGVWTVAYDAAAGAALSDLGEERPELAAAALARLEPLVEQALARRAGWTPRASARVTVAAGLVGGRGVEKALGALAAEGAPGAAAALAELAERGSTAAAEALREALRRHGARQPELYAHCGSLSEGQAMPLLVEAERALPAGERVPVAQGLARLEPAARRDVLVRLLARGEGWTVVHALEALLRAPRAPDLDLVTRTWRGQPHEFVRLQCVRAAAAVGGPAAQEWLVARQGERSLRVRAAAVEALLRMRAAPAVVQATAGTLLDAPLLRARVTGVLALALDAPERVGRALAALVLSPDALERLEGAFALGYLRGPDSAATLGQMALADPCYPVRVQAIKSLAKHPERLAVEPLLAVLAAPEARAATMAARALATLPPSAELAGRLAAALPAGGPVRAAALCALGAAARATGAIPAPLEQALGEDRPSAVGALEGLAYLGDAAAPVLAGLARHADASLRARALTELVLAGRLDALTGLEELVAASDERDVAAGLRAVIAIAASAPVVVRGLRGRSVLAAALQVAPARSAAHKLSGRVAARAPVERPPDARVERVPAPDAKLPPAVVPRALRSEVKARYDQGPRYVALSVAGLLEQVSDLAGLPGAGWLAAPGARAALALAAGLLVVCSWLWLVTPPDPSKRREAEAAWKRALPAGQLAVARVEGEVAVESGGARRPAELGQAVAPGTRVATGKPGRVALREARGGVVWIGPQGALRLEEPAAGMSHAFAAPAGELLFDFRAAPATLASGGERITFQGALRVAPAKGDLSVIVVSGTARDAEGRQVPAGRALTLSVDRAR